MWSKEIRARAEKIALLACVLPAFSLILAAGMVVSRPLEVRLLLLGAGGWTVPNTMVMMLRIAVLGTEPLIDISLGLCLAIHAGLTTLIVADGFALLLLGNLGGFVVIGVGCGQVALIAYFLANDWDGDEAKADTKRRQFSGWLAWGDEIHSTHRLVSPR